MRTPIEELLDELRIDRAESRSDAATAYIDALIEYVVTDLVPYEEKYIKDKKPTETFEMSTQELYYLHGVLDTLPEMPRNFLKKMLSQVEITDLF